MTRLETIKILLVEDEAIIAMAQAQTLNRIGYDVSTAYSGEQAVETALEDCTIDLILMDIDLGHGIDGTEAAQRILQDHHVPIVFLSSHTEPEMVEKVRGITRYGYVLKSSGSFILQQAINTAMELDATYRENEAQRERLDAQLEELQSAHDDLQQREERLTRSNRALRILRRLSRATELVRDDLEFTHEFCKTLHEDGGYALVWVSAISHKPKQTLLPLSVAGRDEGYTEELKIDLDDPIRSQGPSGQVIRTGIAAIVRDIEKDPRIEPWREAALSRGFRSVAVYPVYQDREIWGCFSVYSPTIGAIDQHEQELLNQLAGELSFAMEAIHTRQERAAIQALLAKERSDLQERVKELRCIARLSEIAEDPTLKPSQMMGRVAEIVPPAFQYPEETGVAITLRDQTWTAGAYRSTDSSTRYDAKIVVEGAVLGSVDVVVNGDIIPEERVLIDLIAERLARITERVESLQRERETERRLRMVLEGSRIGTWELDVPTGDMQIDARWAEMLGYVKTELTPMNRHRWRRLCHPEECREVRDRMDAHLRGESEFYSVEMRMLHKVGDWRWILSQAQVIDRDPLGKPLRILGTHTDITSIKESERTGHQEASNAMEVVRSKDLLMHEMHHRIKNDLNLIRSLFSLQASSTGNTETRRCLTEAGYRVSAIARIYETLYQGDDLQYVRIGPLVTTIIRDLRSGLASQNVEINLHIDECLLPRQKSITVGLIINELITNSLKYAVQPDAPTTIGVNVQPHDHNRVLIRVTDTGPGYPEDVLTTGTQGFGLMVIRALVEQNHGTISLRNADGADTSIEIVTEELAT